MVGFLATIEEYLCMYELVGVPDPSGGWRPWAAMTEAEMEESKKEFWKRLED